MSFLLPNFYYTYPFTNVAWIQRISLKHPIFTSCVVLIFCWPHSAYSEAPVEITKPLSAVAHQRPKKNIYKLLCEHFIYHAPCRSSASRFASAAAGACLILEPVGDMSRHIYCHLPDSFSKVLLFTISNRRDDRIVVWSPLNLFVPQEHRMITQI